MMRSKGSRPRSRIGLVIVGVVTVFAVGISLLVYFAEEDHPYDASPMNPSTTTPAAGIFSASGVELTNGANVSALDFSPITVRAVGAKQASVECEVDGVYLGTDSSAPYRFDIASSAAGDHKLRCTVMGDVESTISVRFTIATVAAPTPTVSISQPDPMTPVVTPAPVSVQIVVADAAGLQKALSEARPGTTITLRDGSYHGKEVRDPSGQEPGRFRATSSGTADAPIVLTGSPKAVIDGGGTGGGYALHLKGANYWKLQGFTVRDGSKGIVLDRSSHNVIEGVRVTNIGDEGVHFRAFSSDNVLKNSTVDNTGVDSPNYGEGVYIGSARSNWPTYSGGAPDTSDRNQVLNNSITDTAAENVDIKEGSSNGVVRGNILGGDRIASKNSADSWIDVKGNGYQIDANHGRTVARPTTTECGDPKGDPSSTKNPFCEGIQIHVILDGWGQDNILSGNLLEVNAPGAGIWLQNTAIAHHNVIKCDNQVTGAKAGPFATNHYSPLPCTS